MARFTDTFPDSTLMSLLGDDITYQPSGGGAYPIKAVVEFGVERIGGDGYTVEFNTEVELLINDLPVRPKSGDSLIAEGDHFLVDAVINDDGTYIRLAVK